MDQMGIPCYRCNKRLYFETSVELRHHLKTRHTEIFSEQASEDDCLEKDGYKKHGDVDRMELTEKLEASAKDVAKLHQELDFKDSRIRRLNEDVSVIKAEKKKLETKHDDLQIQLEETQRKFKKIRKAAEKENGIEMENQRMERELEESERSNLVLREENARLKRNISELRERETENLNSQQLELLKQQLEDSQLRVRELEKKAITQTLEIEQLNDSVGKSQRTIDNQQEAIRHLRTGETLMKKENEELLMSKSKLQAEINNLKMQNERQKWKIDELGYEADQQNQKLDELREKVVEERQENKTYQNQLAREKQVREDLRQKLFGATQEITKMRAAVGDREARMKSRMKEFDYTNKLGRNVQEILRSQDPFQLLKEEKQFPNTINPCSMDNSLRDTCENVKIGDEYTDESPYEEAARLNYLMQMGKDVDNDEKACIDDNMRSPRNQHSPRSSLRDSQYQHVSEAMSCLTGKVKNLEKLCFQCKQQNDFFQDLIQDIMQTITNEKKAKLDECVDNKQCIQRLQVLEKNMEEHEKERRREACQFKIDSSRLSESVLELKKLNETIAEQMKQLQSEVARAKHNYNESPKCSLTEDINTYKPDDKEKMTASTRQLMLDLEDDKNSVDCPSWCVQGVYDDVTSLNGSKLDTAELASDRSFVDWCIQEQENDLSFQSLKGKASNQCKEKQGGAVSAAKHNLSPLQCSRETAEQNLLKEIMSNIDIRRLSGDYSAAFCVKRSSRFEFLETQEDEEVKEELHNMASKRELGVIEEDTVKETGNVIDGIYAEIEEESNSDTQKDGLNVTDEVDMACKRLNSVERNEIDVESDNLPSKEYEDFMNISSGWSFERGIDDASSAEDKLAKIDWPLHTDSGIYETTSESNTKKRDHKMSDAAGRAEIEKRDDGYGNDLKDDISVRASESSSQPNNKSRNLLGKFSYPEIQKCEARSQEIHQQGNLCTLTPKGQGQSVDDVGGKDTNVEQTKKCFQDDPLTTGYLKSLDSFLGKDEEEQYEKYIKMSSKMRRHSEPKETYRKSKDDYLGNRRRKFSLYTDRSSVPSNVLTFQNANKYFQGNACNWDFLKKKTPSDDCKRGKTDNMDSIDNVKSSFEITPGNKEQEREWKGKDGRQTREIDDDDKKYNSSTQTKNKETNYEDKRPNFAFEILKRKNLDFELKQELKAKETSEKAAKNRRISTGELDNKILKKLKITGDNNEPCPTSRNKSTATNADRPEVQTEGKKSADLSNSQMQQTDQAEANSFDNSSYSKCLGEENRKKAVTKESQLPAIKFGSDSAEVDSDFERDLEDFFFGTDSDDEINNGEESNDAMEEQQLKEHLNRIFGDRLNQKREISPTVCSSAHLSRRVTLDELHSPSTEKHEFSCYQAASRV